MPLISIRQRKITISLQSFIYNFDINIIQHLFCKIYPWWRHQLETFPALLAICAGNSTVPGKFHAQRPVTRSFDVFFDLRLNKRLSKQSWGWWFDPLSRPLWRHLRCKPKPSQLDTHIDIATEIALSTLWCQQPHNIHRMPFWKNHRIKLFRFDMANDIIIYVSAITTLCLISYWYTANHKLKVLVMNVKVTFTWTKI